MNELTPVHGTEYDDVVGTLYKEARLLEKEDFRAWLKLVHPDIRYQAYNQQLRFRKDKRYKLADKVYSLDERYEFLDARIRQFETGVQWTADPQERVRRFLSNIEVFKSPTGAGYQIFLSVFVVRNRRVYEEMTYSYGREEEWIRVDGELRLIRRVADIDERFLHGKNLNFFL